MRIWGIFLVGFLQVGSCLADERVLPQVLERKVELEFEHPDGKRSGLISAEVALTPQERAKGLMARMDIEGLRGMLFVFPDVAPRSFWMKNTPLELDMIFLDEQDRVACLIERVPPNTTVSRPCMTPGRYVLELRGGQAAKIGIRNGSTLRFVGEKPFAAF